MPEVRQECYELVLKLFSSMENNQKYDKYENDSIIHDK